MNTRAGGFPFLLVSSVLAFGPVVSAQQGDAAKLFQTLAPSVVLITDEEGIGSGIVLTESGMILTNYHVVSSPLPMTVEASVGENGREVRKRFPNASLFKVHPKCDLALIKVDGKGCKFKPARLAKSSRETRAGGACFVLGYPYVPKQNSPALTITKGIISSAGRAIDGVEYIQMDAAVNPGNSGGVLANDAGLVIGVPTLKIIGSDRISLATPVAGLKVDQFVEAADKKGNPDEAARLGRLADLLVLRDAFSLGLDSESAQLALYLQREALALEPNNPKWAASLAGSYFRLQKHALARAYGEIAVKNDSNNIYARDLLAAVYDRLNEKEKACAQRMACLELPIPPNGQTERRQLFDRLALGFAAIGEFARAAYVISWAQAQFGEERSGDRRLALQKASQALPESLMAEIMAKKTGHSVKDMNEFAHRAPASKPAADREPVSPVDVRGAQPEQATVQTFRSTVSLKSGVKARLMDAPHGVVFRPEDNTLEWTPPPFSTQNEARVLFLLSNPDGSEEAYIHTITRQPPR